MKNIREFVKRIVNVILRRPDPNLWFCEGCGWSEDAWPCEIDLAIRNKAYSGWCIDCKSPEEVAWEADEAAEEAERQWEAELAFRETERLSQYTMAEINGVYDSDYLDPFQDA